MTVEDDADREMVDRLLDHHPPRDSEVIKQFAHVRTSFKTVAYYLIDVAPRTPDRTVALRSIHRACMDSIASIACNQSEVPTYEG